MRAPNLLLIEDDDVLGASLVQRLGLEGFTVRWARTARQASEDLEKGRYDIVVSDIRLPDGDGETVMRGHFAQMGLVPIIFMTAYGDVDQAVRLVRDGAWDYLTKPFDLDALVDRLNRLSFSSRSSAEKAGATTSASPAMQSVAEILSKAADLMLPVTLMGETGTGKEIAARFLHSSSVRKNAPFVAVNAGLLASEMADSALFGHERGAFTGATGSRIGYVEEAGQGTLFLDEIGELDLAMQVKLLRLIEERRFRRLGGTRDVPFNARLICATNRDLEAMVAEDGFRRDLWFRINVITATLPPLRVRKEDILPLLAQRAHIAAAQFGRAVPEISPQAQEIALTYHWPGNIRELVNRMDRAMAMTRGNIIAQADLFPDLDVEPGPAVRENSGETLAEAREAAERAHIIEALKLHNGKIQPAAKQLGISRTTLWDKMRRYAIGNERER